MRPREEMLEKLDRGTNIVSDKIIFGKSGYINTLILDSILEVLLDIRELLYDEQNKPY